MAFVLEPLFSGSRRVKLAAVAGGVQVDELGTEAAAVTSVSVMPTSAPLDPPDTLEFNRPFAAAVVHNPSGAVLFAGEVAAPQAWSSAGD